MITKINAATSINNNRRIVVKTQKSPAFGCISSFLKIPVEKWENAVFTNSFSKLLKKLQQLGMLFSQTLRTSSESLIFKSSVPSGEKAENTIKAILKKFAKNNSLEFKFFLQT